MSRPSSMSDEHRLADDVAQRRLRRPADRGAIVGDVERGLLRIDHLPEQHRVDVDRHGVLGQRLFGLERAGDHPDVDPVGDAVDDRDDEEDARPAQRVKAPKPQHDGAVPLIGHLGRRAGDGSEQEGDEADDDGRLEGVAHAIGNEQPDAEDHDEDEGGNGVGRTHGRTVGRFASRRIQPRRPGT